MVMQCIVGWLHPALGFNCTRVLTLVLCLPVLLCLNCIILPRSIAPHAVFTLLFLDALPKLEKQFGL